MTTITIPLWVKHLLDRYAKYIYGKKRKGLYYQRVDKRDKKVLDQCVKVGYLSFNGKHYKLASWPDMVFEFDSSEDE